MATLTIRDLDDELLDRLRVRAAHHGRSIQAEIRAILSETLAAPSTTERLGTRIHQRFAEIGGLDIALPERTERPRVAAPPTGLA